MHVSGFRPPLAALVLALSTGVAAATSERDKAWEALIAAAKAHGGVETKLDQSASYVFKQADGSFVTFTQMQKGGKRAACLVSAPQDATVCVDWDSGKTTYGDRKDVASPWIVRPAPVADPDAEPPNLLSSLLSSFGSVLGMGPKFSCCDRYGNLIFSKRR